MDDNDLCDLLFRLDRDGYAVAKNVVGAIQIAELRLLCQTASYADTVSRRGDAVYGIRNLLTSVPQVQEVVSRHPFIDIATAALGRSTRPVYGVYFDKPAGANWPVPWHQDVTIRVRERKDVPGFEPRPVKDGVVHMLPPVQISEQILTLRIHLDDATAMHGALRVIPGSHRMGRLTNEQNEHQCANVEAETCEVQAGDVMLMRPLLLHASSACERPEHRRVIHIEYAAFDLPGGLRWEG